MKQDEYITDEQVVERAKAAVRLAVEKKKVLGIPVVAYDSKTKEVYQINSDGSRTVLAKSEVRGRYSERCKSNQEA